MAVQFDAVYRLIGPDGTTAVFNDKDSADFVGYLDQENGVSGLDSPEARESADVLVEADGGVHGSFYHGRRPVVISGSIWPEGDVGDSDETAVAKANARQDKLLRAANAMRADARLVWTETGSAVEKQLYVRRQQPARIAGRRPKTFQVSLVSAAAEIESSSEQSLVILSGATGLLGFAFPLAFPLEWAVAAGGQQFVVNSGNAPAYPRVRFDGPLTNPRLLNNTTGEEFRLSTDILDPDYVEVDFRRRTVLLNGTSSRYSAVDFPSSVWWKLQPGNNDVRLNATAAGGNAQATVYWHHSWI